MSFSIALRVHPDGDIELVSASSDAAAPPEGSYTISGHKATADAPAPSVAVNTPIGGCSAYAVPTP